jgi:hypothetical protein
MDKYNRHTEENLFKDVKILLTMQKGVEAMVVEYNPYKWTHNVYSDNSFVGATSLKEFLKDGWICIDRKIVLSGE